MRPLRELWGQKLLTSDDPDTHLYPTPTTALTEAPQTVPTPAGAAEKPSGAAPAAEHPARARVVSLLAGHLQAGRSAKRLRKELSQWRRQQGGTVLSWCDVDALMREAAQVARSVSAIKEAPRAAAAAGGGDATAAGTPARAGSAEPTAVAVGAGCNAPCVTTCAASSSYLDTPPHSDTNTSVSHTNKSDVPRSQSPSQPPTSTAKCQPQHSQSASQSDTQSCQAASDTTTSDKAPQSDKNNSQQPARQDHTQVSAGTGSGAASTVPASKETAGSGIKSVGSGTKSVGQTPAMTLEELLTVPADKIR